MENYMDPTELLQRQRELEEDGLSMGAKRFQDRLERAMKDGSIADQGAAKKLMEQGFVKFGDAIQFLIDEGKNQRGKKNAGLVWCERIGAHKAAYIALRTAFAASGRRLQLVQVSKEISKRILDEIKFRRLEEEAPELFKYRMSKFATTHYLHRSHSLDQAIKYTQGEVAANRGYAPIETDDLTMTPSEIIVLGTFLIDRMIESTGLFEILSDVSRNKRHKRLVPTQETLEWLATRNDALRLMEPMYPPMVVQPLPWGRGLLGGYRFALRGSNKLIRGYKKDHKRLIDTADMEPVYRALNIIQNTEWCINKPLLETLISCIENGGGVAGIPSFEPYPDVPRKPGMDDDKEILRRWKREQAARRTENVQRQQECIKFIKVRDAAKEYSKEEGPIYFPHSLDFRGRIYPIPTAISPQGDDLNKALLKFHYGKPLGTSGLRYLAIHGANAMGVTKGGQKVSKLTLDERVEVIQNNHGDILRYADDPLANVGWMLADEPWCFLAFCFEWAAAHKRINPCEYVSSLPIASDGTCNGLQHYSALLMDPVAAQAVNVLNNARPKDIYQEVAEAVLERLAKEAGSDPMSLKWLDSKLVNRSLCKRPTMTLAYGAKQYGFKDQLVAYLKGLPLRDLQEFLKYDEGTGEMVPDVHGPCVHMATRIWESLGDVVVSAQEGMSYFQRYARTVSKAGLNPTWVVPGTGFLVYQDSRPDREKSTVKTILCGKVYYPRTYLPGDKVCPIKAANGIAPNIIHSLDAACLMLTVNRAADVGVTSFAMVHDSYGTHAADAEILNIELRQAFFKLYNQDVLGYLQEQFEGQIQGLNEKALEESERPEKVKLLEFPEVPKKGNLDLSKVLISDYFFC